MSTAMQLDAANGALIVTWGALVTGDTGITLGLAGENDKTVTISGTATSFALQGSNDGTNWFTLSDIGPAATAITAVGIFVIKENPKFIRPLLTTGAVSVVICAR